MNALKEHLWTNKDHERCGKCSGIPDCCVDFFIQNFNDRTDIDKRRYLQGMFTKGIKYVPCPSCMKNNRIVKLKQCDSFCSIRKALDQHIRRSLAAKAGKLKCEYTDGSTVSLKIASDSAVLVLPKQPSGWANKCDIPCEKRIIKFAKKVVAKIQPMAKRIHQGTVFYNHIKDNLYTLIHVGHERTARKNKSFIKIQEQDNETDVKNNTPI